MKAQLLTCGANRDEIRKLMDHHLIGYSIILLVFGTVLIFKFRPINQTAQTPYSFHHEKGPTERRDLKGFILSAMPLHLASKINRVGSLLHKGPRLHQFPEPTTGAKCQSHQQLGPIRGLNEDETLVDNLIRVFKKLLVLQTLLEGETGAGIHAFPFCLGKVKNVQSDMLLFAGSWISPGIVCRKLQLLNQPSNLGVGLA